jgi:hypothetical protein
MPAFPFREAPATPQHQSRRARDDDEGEGEFISPPSAQYAQRDAAEPTELRFPPLAFDAGVAALRQRFKLVMDEDELMPDIKDFKPETILTGLKKRLRDHGLAKDRDSSFGPASAPPPCIQRPAFDKVWFLAEPMDAGQELRSLKFYSVPSSALAQLMVRRGYVVVYVTHLPNDDTRLPPAVDEQTRGPRAGAAGSHVENEVHPAPMQLTVPDKVISIDTSPSAPSPTAQIVEQPSQTDHTYDKLRAEAAKLSSVAEDGNKKADWFTRAVAVSMSCMLACNILLNNVYDDHESVLYTL